MTDSTQENTQENNQEQNTQEESVLTNAAAELDSKDEAQKEDPDRKAAETLFGEEEQKSEEEGQQNDDEGKEQKDESEEDKKQEDEEDKKQEDEKVGEIDFQKLEENLPDGFELNDEVREVLGDIIKDTKLKQSEVEKLVPVGQKIAEGVIKKQVEQLQEVRKAWREDLKKDPILSKDENVGKAAQTLRQFGDSNLQQFLAETGLGDHPSLIKFCFNISQALSEDRILEGAGSSDIEKSPAEIMFGNN